MASNTYSNKASIFTPPAKTASPFMATRQTASPLGTALASASSGKSSGITPSASTPLKSVTTNNVDGSSTRYEYHAPAKESTGLTEADVRNNLAKAGYTNSAGLLRNGDSSMIGQSTQQPGYSEKTYQEQYKANPDSATGTVEPSPYGTGVFGQSLQKGTEALKEAAKVESQAGLLRQRIAQQKQNIMLDPNAAGAYKLGAAGIIDQNLGTQLSALSDQQKALTSEGQAYMTQAGLIPEALRYGTGGSTQLDPATQASNYANDVISGNRSYADALSAMGLYGNAGRQFLDQAIKSANPSFNFAQAQTLGANQGSIKPAYDYATTALNSLAAAVKNLGFSQGTNIPAVNSIGDWLSQTFGINSEQTRNYKTAIAEARSAIQKVLASVQGGTPTDYVAQSMALLPDNATPNDIASAQKTLETLGAAKVGIYSNPGSASTPTQQTSTGLFNW